MKIRPFILLSAIAVMLLALIAFAVAPTSPKGIGVAVAGTTAVTAFATLRPMPMVANRSDPPYHQRIYDYNKPQDRESIHAIYGNKSVCPDDLPGGKHYDGNDRYADVT